MYTKDSNSTNITAQTSSPPHYPRLSVVVQQYLWMNEPIDSLPGLCSVEGATTTLGFTYCTTMSWIFILFFLIIMRYRRSCEFELQMTDGLMYLGGSCLYGVHLFKVCSKRKRVWKTQEEVHQAVLLPMFWLFSLCSSQLILITFHAYTWQLNRCRRTRHRLHLIATLIGAACISVCAVLSAHFLPFIVNLSISPTTNHQTVCGVQQYSLGTTHWVRYLMVFVIMWFGFYAAFFHFGTTCYSEMVEKYSFVAVNKITDEDRKEISSLSRKIIWCEMATILILAVGVANWMWFYDIGCAYGCRGPVKEECYWRVWWRKVQYKRYCPCPVLQNNDWEYRYRFGCWRIVRFFGLSQRRTWFHFLRWTRLVWCRLASILCIVFEWAVEAVNCLWIKMSVWIYLYNMRDVAWRLRNWAWIYNLWLSDAGMIDYERSFETVVSVLKLQLCQIS